MTSSLRRSHRIPTTLAVAFAVLAIATTAPAASLSDFGRCLAREGAVFYGTSWCPYCKAQRQSLGAAMSHVRYVECSVDGSRDETAAECVQAGVRSYPTWVFGDGSRAGGALPLSALAAKTGCPLPQGSARPAGPPPGAAEAAKPGPAKPGPAKPGPKIIEVPQ